MRSLASPSLEFGPSSDETLDELLRGRVRLLQPRRGARVSLDALLLADFARRQAGRPARVLDLGCGSGAVALCLATAFPGARLVGIELQPALAALARRNAALNGVADRLEIVVGDLRRARQAAAAPLEPDAFDLVVSNPPWHDEKGRVSPSRERAIARSELACTIEDVVAAARRWVRPRGRVALVLPAARLADLCASLVAAGLRPRALRPVHSLADEPARRVLALAVRGYRGGPELLPPLVVHGADHRTYTPEAAEILGERSAAGRKAIAGSTARVGAENPSFPRPSPCRR